MFPTAKELLGRLNGWQRIGVILSIAWAIAMVTATAIQYSEAESIEAELSRDWPTLGTKFFVRWYDAKNGSSLSVWADKRTLTYPDARDRANLLLSQIHSGTITPMLGIAYHRLALALFVPITLLWCFAYVVTWLYKWVRNGFRRNV